MNNKGSRSGAFIILFDNDLLAVDDVESLFGGRIHLLTVQVVPLVVINPVIASVGDDFDTCYHIVIIIGILHVGNDTIRGDIRWIA